MDPEQFSDLLFPVNGIDKSMELELQPPDTTAIGLNVRGYEPSTMRQRGGARPGIVKYVPAQVDGSNVIQHLTYIVDPAGEALLTNADQIAVSGTIVDPSSNNGGPGGGYGLVTGPITLGPYTGSPTSPVLSGITPPPAIPNVPPPPFPTTTLGYRNVALGDPFTLGTARRIASGGSGVQPNRRIPQGSPIGPEIFQQTTTSGTFANNTNLNSLLVVAVTTGFWAGFTPTSTVPSPPPPPVSPAPNPGAVNSVTDDSGNTWIQIGTQQFYSVTYMVSGTNPNILYTPFIATGALSLWYAINNASGVPLQVTANFTGQVAGYPPGDTPYAFVSGFEVGGVSVISPLQGFSSTSDSTQNQTSNAIACGPLTISHSNTLLFGAVPNGGGVSYNSPFTITGPQNFGFVGTPNSLFAFNSFQQPGTVTMNGTMANMIAPSPANPSILYYPPYAAMIAAFNHA